MTLQRFPVDEQYCQVKFESFGMTNKQVSGLVITVHNLVAFQIQLAWMEESQNNVNANISLAQFGFEVMLMDAYSTDYYDISYPGLIMKVNMGRRGRRHI
jgi:hypothetical protein